MCVVATAAAAMVSAREDRKACAGSGGNTGAESRRLGSSLAQSSTRVEQRNNTIETWEEK
jgi:hypothetical protein